MPTFPTLVMVIRSASAAVVPVVNRRAPLLPFLTARIRSSPPPPGILITASPRVATLEKKPPAVATASSRVPDPSVMLKAGVTGSLISRSRAGVFVPMRAACSRPVRRSMTRRRLL